MGENNQSVLYNVSLKILIWWRSYKLKRLVSLTLLTTFEKDWSSTNIKNNFKNWTMHWWKLSWSIKKSAGAGNSTRNKTNWFSGIKDICDPVKLFRDLYNLIFSIKKEKSFFRGES